MLEEDERLRERQGGGAREAELKPLVGGPIVAQMFDYDTHPATARNAGRDSGK